MNMRKRALGKTGLEVSQLGFGCMRLPLLDHDKPESVNAPEAVRMIRRAAEAGVNYFDTAFPYHGSDRMKPGRSESVLGEALSGGLRDKVIIATKLPLWALEKPDDMERILDGQLERLGTDHIDLYLAHNIVSPYWQKVKDLGLFAFLDRARKNGRIRHPGFSFHDDYALFRQVLEEYPWELAQIQYNYLDVNYQAGRRGLAAAAAKGMGVAIMEPLRGGFLVNNIPEDSRSLLRERRPNWSLADWGLRWLWDQPEAGVVLSGMSSMEQLEENLRIAADAGPGTFAAADREAIEKVRARFAERMGANCTACGYCLPCPAGVAIPKIFSTYNEYLLSDAKEVKDRAKVFYGMTMSESERADKCVDCKLCETKCPQHVPVASLMPRVAELLGAAT
ncbi:MAG: aldo/keto reductase [Planctomycetota bacterium]|jgi:predicted aldo/keto reductase-like oxidoreductase|nr:aldo/keto reductase [Planctomycetota bacterium]